MSLVGTRTEIADLLSAVEGVNGYAYRPTTPRPGDAWPILPSLNLQDGLVWRPEWSVVVFLPQDERAAAQWLDTNFESIANALRGGSVFPESADLATESASGTERAVLLIKIRGNI